MTPTTYWAFFREDESIKCSVKMSNRLTLIRTKNRHNAVSEVRYKRDEELFDKMSERYRAVPCSQWEFLTVSKEL